MTDDMFPSEVAKYKTRQSLETLAESATEIRQVVTALNGVYELNLLYDQVKHPDIRKVLLEDLDLAITALQNYKKRIEK